MPDDPRIVAGGSNPVAGKARAGGGRGKGHRGMSPGSDSGATKAELQSINAELTSAHRELKRDTDAQLRQLTAELTRSEQHERARMARLLHDHVQQLLVSAKMRLQAVARHVGEREKEELEVVVALMNESLANSRSLEVELSPPLLNEGLAPALEWLGNVWMKEKHGFTVHLDLDQRLDTPGEELRALVFLAVRELLFNVVKHAGVSEAFVEFAAEDAATLRVAVRDHGRGFDPSILDSGPKGAGLGLFGMRGRIGVLGGTLSLRSGNGNGVEAIIRAPRGPDLSPPASF